MFPCPHKNCDQVALTRNKLLRHIYSKHVTKKRPKIKAFKP